MIDYSGDRSAAHLKDWAISLIPNKVISPAACCHLGLLDLGATSSRAPGAPADVRRLGNTLGPRHCCGVIAQVTTVNKQAQLDALLKRCAGAAGRGGAAWGACLVLATDKPVTSPLYLSLAAEYDGRLAFGEVRRGSRDLLSTLGVERWVPLAEHAFIAPACSSAQSRSAGGQSSMLVFLASSYLMSSRHGS